MTRRITAAWTAALCTTVLAMAQVSAGQVPAKTTPAKTTPAKATPAKAAAPAKAAPAKASAQTAAVPSVTLTGCLHTDDDKFMLKDVEGTKVSKHRNWKTGFITKSTKDLELVAASSVNLQDQVGHKVSVVGTREGDTHFRARSLKRVAESCS